MVRAMNRLGLIHYLDRATELPACRKDAERALWNWSLEPAAVTCRSCRVLLRTDAAIERDGSAGSSREHEHHRSITRSP